MRSVRHLSEEYSISISVWHMFDMVKLYDGSGPWYIGQKLNTVYTLNSYFLTTPDVAYTHNRSKYWQNANKR